MTFSCEGAVSKWIVVAEWVDVGTSYPEMQIWRLTQPSSVVDTYEIANSVELRITEESPNKVYEYTVDPPMPFLAGDIVGVFEPNSQKGHIQLYFKGQGPTSYFHHSNEPFSPFIPANVCQDDASLLIAVEIGKRQEGKSAVIQIVNPLPTNDAPMRHDLCELSISLWEFIWGILGTILQYMVSASVSCFLWSVKG